MSYPAPSRDVSASASGSESTRPNKGYWLALTGVERVAGLRFRLYELYDRDVSLIEALVDFHARWWARIGRYLRRLDDCLPDTDDAWEVLAELVGPIVADAYLGDFHELVSGAGLDRIQLYGTPPVVVTGYLPSGAGQAHRFLWHLDKAILWERAVGIPSRGGEVGRPTFVSLTSFGAGIPSIDTRILGTSTRWEPRTESLAKARRRLPDQTGLATETIEAELMRIARDGRYEFPDTSTVRENVWRLDRDAQWVWWRIRRRLTYAEIAAEWAALHPRDFHFQPRSDHDARQWDRDHPEEAGALTDPADAVEMVRKAVRVYARRAGVRAQTGPGRPTR
jgi:hypothetical protein